MCFFRRPDAFILLVLALIILWCCEKKLARAEEFSGDEDDFEDK